MDQIAGSGTYETILGAKNRTLLVIGIIILTAYDFKDFIKSQIELPIINLTCNYKDSDNIVQDIRPRTPECSPRVYQNKNTLIFETTGFCHSVILIDINTITGLANADKYIVILQFIQK